MTGTIARFSLPLLLILAVSFASTQALAQSRYDYDPDPPKTIEDLSAGDLALTVLAGEAGMIAGALGAGLLGGILGLAMISDDCHEFCEFPAVAFGVIGGVAGGYIGLPVGVTMAGNALGYDGSFTGSLLGSTLGLGASLSLLAFDDSGVLVIAALFILPVAGATAGYFMGTSSREDLRQDRAWFFAQLQPGHRSRARHPRRGHRPLQGGHLLQRPHPRRTLLRLTQARHQVTIIDCWTMSHGHS